MCVWDMCMSVCVYENVCTIVYFWMFVWVKVKIDSEDKQIDIAIDYINSVSLH